MEVGELTNAKVLWPLLKQGVHHFFGLMFFGHRRGRCHLLPLSLLSLRLKKRKMLVPSKTNMSTMRKFVGYQSRHLNT